MKSSNFPVRIGFLLIGLTILFFLSSCPSNSLLWMIEPSGMARRVGHAEVISISGFPAFTMIYAQDQESISFPTGINDDTHATVTTRFWMAQTQFTNAQASAVLQWAYDNGKIVTTGDAHNEVNSTEVKYGGQRLVWFAGTHNRLNYDESSGNFTVKSGFEEHPLVEVTWYGAVMFCNWLTEMRDSQTDNLVYSNIDTSGWSHDDTEEDTTKNGYRLPSTYEWEYAARYLGTTEPLTGGDLDTERLYGNDNHDWTDGYYWTPGNYASGATADYTDAAACRAVAVYSGSDPQPETTKSVKTRAPNLLSLYDMSGNVWEWCYTASDTNRIRRGGGWYFHADSLQVGSWFFHNPGSSGSFLGFRLSRTAD